MIPHVTQVVSNVKGGVNVTIGPKTVISGPPMSGKSAIVNSIELALSGAATDVAGRDSVKAADAVLPLADGKEVVSEVTLSDGRVSKYGIGGKAGRKGKVTAPTGFPENLDTLFPLWAVREALTGSGAAARSFLLQFVIGNVKVEDVVAQIPAALRPKWHDASRGPAGSAHDLTDKLYTALDVAKKRAGEAKARAKIANEIAVGSGSGTDLPPNESEIADAKAEVQKLRTSVETLVGEKAVVKSKSGGLVLKRSEAEQLDRAMAKLEADYPALVQAVADLSAKEQEIELRLKNATEAKEAHPPSKLVSALATAAETTKVCHDEGYDFCLTCGTQGIGPTKWKGHQATLEAAIEEETRNQQAFTAAAQEYAQAESAATEWVAAYEKAVKARDDAEAKFKDLSERREKIGDLTDDSAELSDLESREHQARASLATAEQKLSQLEQAAASWKPSQVASDTAVAESQDASEWKLLLTTVETLIAKYVKKGTADFVATVQKCLPPHLQFGIEIGTACRLGLRQLDGFLRTALSGSEWATVTAGITLALTKDAPFPQVVIPEDRGYDLGSITAMCEAFKDSPAQVVIPTTVPIGEKALPEGWTLISLW